MQGMHAQAEAAASFPALEVDGAEGEEMEVGEEEVDGREQDGKHLEEESEEGVEAQAEGEELQSWLQCDRCRKWRVVTEDCMRAFQVGACTLAAALGS